MDLLVKPFFVTKLEYVVATQKYVGREPSSAWLIGAGPELIDKAIRNPYVASNSAHGVLHPSKN